MNGTEWSRNSENLLTCAVQPSVLLALHLCKRISQRNITLPLVISVLSSSHVPSPIERHGAPFLHFQRPVSTSCVCLLETTESLCGLYQPAAWPDLG
jgi:hypothetical protein